AMEDFSKIWGVINISAVNQNGRSITPITRPSQIEQENLLRSIYETHVNPSIVQYIEAHGTGTAAGDPTEAASLASVISKGRSSKELLNPELSQPMLFTLQVALASLLKYWGIKPVAAVGHSVGEIAAAHFAGYLSLSDAVKVIYHRSRLQAKTPSGRMLVVGNIPVQEIAECLHPYSGKVCIAAFNSPITCTLSGNPDAVDAVQKDLAQTFSQRNIFLHVLNVPAAYHSPSMDMILGELEETIQPLEKQKGEIEVISTLTGMAASANDFIQGKFWARHTREPVAFTQAIETAYGSIFRQLSDVHYCQELKEAITSIKVNKETVQEMHSYCIHPVLLDCFLQMT
uniref:PKS/mFAS DH domain-containing protein n=1 Tax=Anas platyrhynchos TaxID=8839 RepID=A0A8B9SUH9_ANAPL